MVSIVAVSVFSKGRFLEGAVPAFTRSSDYQDYCTDDDPEDNFYVTGTAQMGNKLYADYCSGDVLLQQYCSSGRNVKTRRPYICPNGCLNGVCLN